MILRRPVFGLAFSSAVAACGVAACGGGSGSVTAPTSEPVVLPTAVASAAVAPAASANDKIGVNLVNRPAEFVLDGEIAEWDNFAPFDPGADPEEPEEPREQEPVAVENVGAVGLVVEQAEVLVVGHLPAPAAQAVWIGVGNRPAQLPYIGTLGRAAASFDPVVCSEFELDFTDGMYVKTDRPTPPETLAACKAVVARYDEYAAEQNARFARVLRVDASGVFDGAAANGAPIAGAKLQWKKHPDGSASFEAALPTAVLPRIGAAPLMSMRLLARTQALTVPASRWTSVALPMPLSFEPYGQLRADLYQVLSGYTLPYQAPPGLSFLPSKPTLIESYDFSEQSIIPSESEIFVELAKLGDVRIGKVNVARSFLASFKGEEYVELYEPIHGWGPTRTTEPVARNGAHHLIHYSERLYSGGMTFEPPGCSVTEVGKDGRFKELLAAEADMPPTPESGGMWWNFDNGELVFSKGFSEFGYRGVARGNDVEQEATKKWRWDAKKKIYVSIDWKMGPSRNR